MGTNLQKLSVIVFASCSWLVLIIQWGARSGQEWLAMGWHELDLNWHGRGCKLKISAMEGNGRLQTYSGGVHTARGGPKELRWVPQGLEENWRSSGFGLKRFRVP
ncbi:hypothetical protein CRG98_015711 [Punica granatum]|uniref:Uncharacterized protein n=1 Tax=Punica granatum TaxID=22663 RepID=A0A2I0K6Z8_PUNGR|nr:hypothetical protein CRG98_015711 [Punica granatum]